MNCSYCDRILAVDPAYTPLLAAYDLSSAAPRCVRHWRYLCARCGQPHHFMATAWCPDTQQFFCSDCAIATEQVEEAFWCWRYHFQYRSPWTQKWQVSLDRLEYDGFHPLQRFSGSATPAGVSEVPLTRYPVQATSWRQDALSDDEVRAAWNLNADRWDAVYDEDGDRNRRLQSDETLLRLLGEVRGLRVLDVGSGQGYLCRKLAAAGASTVGVELSDRFLEIAKQHGKRTPSLDITYHQGSVAEMPFLADASMDRAVSNYVLMDVRDYVSTVREVYRVLKPGGVFVVVISHPCFGCGPGGWERPAPDSPRQEERTAFRVDNYFLRGPMKSVWGKFDPVPGFHRPLRDYWETFRGAGFRVEEFDEPSISERGMREMSLSERMKAMRIPYSCAFKLVK